MRNSNTVDGLRLAETIVNFKDNLTSLGFKKPPNKEFGQIDADLIKKFLENKIRQQNQEYSRKAKDGERSGGYGSAFAKPSTFYRPINDDTKSQIENLLDHAIQNEGKGSFESRNASALNITSSLIRKALSSTSISSGGNHSNQQNYSLQKSKSLPTQHTSQKANETQSRGGHINLKMPTSKIKPTNRKKTLGKRISDVWSRITFKKTKQQNAVGTSRALAKPNKVNQSSSSLAISRSGLTHQSSNSSNASKSYTSDTRQPQSIANRNRSLSLERNARISQGSFKSQNSFNSLGSHASINQSRSNGKKGNNLGR